MKRVMLVGLDPATVDFSDPALPPGMNAEKIHEGVEVALADMAARGWQAENCFINPDETAVPTVERRLAEGRYDCVVLGAGVRLPPGRLVLFEALVNAIHRAAPGAAVAFNTRPESRRPTVAATIGHSERSCLLRGVDPHRPVLTTTRRVDLLRRNCGPVWADERPAPRRESATVLCNML